MDEFETDMDISPMREAAAYVHEVFTSLVAEGFAEIQALYMCGVMMAHGNDGEV